MSSKIARAAGLALVLGLGFIQPAAAHHSFSAVFDDSKEMSVNGRLSRVEWVNPHAFFEVEVPGKGGAVTTWRFENFPPAMLRNLGLNRTMMTDNIGKKVKVDYNPTRKPGSNFGYGRVFTFDGGKQIVFTPKGGEPSGAR